jgi:uncharacterized membrane protein (DUF4010 family)
MNITESTLLGLGAALGAGLLIGIERERRKGSGPQRALAGARTFTLASLAGAIAHAMAEPWLVAIGAVFILVLAAIGYWRDRSDDPGITTELALFVTYLLGVTAIEHPALAAGAAVVVTALLASRRYLHDFSIEVLTEVELRDALVFAGAALVVLPLLPDHPLENVVGLNPRRLWGLVIVFMALQAFGYIALRAFGTRLGLALSGFAAGFVSSTATIAAMGTRARHEPQLLLACVSGAFFSTLTTVLLLAIVAVAVFLPVLPIIAPSIVLAFIAAAGVATLSLRAKTKTAITDLPKGRAFNLFQGLGFAIGLTAITAIVAFANRQFGQLAVGISTGLAGFFDVHAASASVFALAAGQKIVAADVLMPMLFAVTTNTVSKVVAAYFGGGFAYAWRVALGLALVLFAAWAPLLWLS